MNSFIGDEGVGNGGLKVGKLPQQHQQLLQAKETPNWHHRNGFLDLLNAPPSVFCDHCTSPLSSSPDSTSKSSAGPNFSLAPVANGVNLLATVDNGVKVGKSIRPQQQQQQQQQTLHQHHYHQNGFLNHHLNDDPSFNKQPDSASNGRSSSSLGAITNGFHHHDGFLLDRSALRGFSSGTQQLVLDQNSLIQGRDISSMNTALTPPSSLRNGAGPNPDTVSPEDSEIFSDMMLSYINQMLMEEDMGAKLDVCPEHPALLAVEKPFYDILGNEFSPSPERPSLYCSQCEEIPDESIGYQFGSSNCGASACAVLDNGWAYNPLEYHHQFQSCNPVSVGYSSHSSFSSTGSELNVIDGLEESLSGSLVVSDLLIQSKPVWQFQRGIEAAHKFLPGDKKLMIDFESNGIYMPQEAKEEKKFVEVKDENEEKEDSLNGSRGKKNYHDDDLDQQEGRSNKQSAVFAEVTLRTDLFDKILLCNGENCAAGVHELREALQSEAIKCSHASHSKGSGGGKGRGKKQQTKEEVFDLRTLLIHCAQSVAADDRRNANELLKQIRKHASPHGDANQRLANYFADGLEARLAGTGSQVYHSLVAKRMPATDVLRAYGLYAAACPFKKISHFFSSQTILNVAEKATKLHIIDYGIYYGFQWPCFMKRLSNRPNGPPELRITGIDNPVPGFRPTELIDETGHRLAEYARSFGIPFKFHAIANNWERITVEDLNIDKDEVLIVNSLFGFKSLADETVVVDSPRDMVLNTIRKLNPTVFIHGILNGSYNAPFFVTRFREALFHYSALFDMIETNVPRRDELRQLMEKVLYGWEVVNVISCEGVERVERPETYKQWQVRNLRAGFTQLPLNPDIMRKAKDKYKSCYHKDFVIDEDSRWLLQGWKGRILFALSTWKPKSS